jgi:Vitamin B12 dependent methionine synthase, activation domain
MKEAKFHFDFKDLKIDASRIKHVLGENKGEELNLVNDLIEDILKDSGELNNIKAQYLTFNDIKFDDNNHLVSLSNISFNVGKVIFSQIKKSESIAVLLSTAGEEITTKSRNAMQEGDLLKGYIYDIFGSLVVESAVDLMTEKFKENLLSEAEKITAKYSPGYCGWDVAEQHKLFQLIPDNFCGIVLTQSALMKPVKSLSGIIGIGENVKFNPNTCKICGFKDCIYRS